ncbi:MAG: 2-dehydropantoate 2-reductase N-terminal domain-containing protein, partial [Verrucomicrobiales bacterium]
MGVGAVGGSCAAPLGAVRDDVVLCLRTPFLELKVRGFDVPEVVTPRVIVSPNDLSPARWVLLATKAHQVEGASSWLERLVGSDTRVAVLQNGVEHVERLCGMVPSEQVLPVVVDCPACVLAPGRIEARHAPHLIVPERMEGQAFAVLFKGTSVGMETTADFVIALWRKPCVNAIAALAGVSLPEVRHPRLSEIAQALVRECAAVERAEGAEI